jgi:hypothetical protein
MTLHVLEALGPVRVALLANTAIVSRLGTWAGSSAIFTKRPVPDNVEYPLIIVGPLSGRNGSGDGINDHRPVAILDVIAYGMRPDHDRLVDEVAELVFSQFHQQRNVVINNYNLTQILCEGPFPAPADDEKSIARRVRLNLRLRAHFL